jgi:hypothetical protein
MEQFREASVGIERVREAMNRFREAMQNELPVAEAVRAVLGTMAVRALETGASFKDVAEQAKDMRQAMVRFNEVVIAGMPVEEAEALILKDLAASFEADAIAANQASGATTAASGAGLAGAGGFLAIAAAVLAVVAAVQLLLPPLLLVIAAVSVLASFAVAGAGMLALLGAIGLAIGGLGAATLALGIAGMGGTGAAAQVAKTQAAVIAAQQGLARAEASGGVGGAAHALRVAQAQEKLAAAQQSYAAALQATHSPISVFMAHLNEMAQDFTKAAEPFAKLIIQFGDKALPAIEKLGMGILQWFGHRIPGILAQISRLVKDLTPDFQAFGQFLGAMFDRNEGKIAPMAEAFVRFGLSLTTGLLGTLERLSNWFLERLPTYGPVVKQILGFIGNVVLGVAGAFGHFADYVVKNWPGWVKTITDAWNSKGAQDIRKNLPSDIDDLRKSFEEVMKQAPVWVPQIFAVADAIARIANSVLAVVGAMDRLNGWLQAHPALGWLLGIGVNPGGGGGTGTGKNDNNFNKGGFNSRGQPMGTGAITINVNGAKSPASTARAVATQLSRLTAV